MANRISILVALEGADEGLKRAITSAERSLGEFGSNAKTAGDKAAAGMAEVKAGMNAFGDQVAKAKTQLLTFLTLNWAAGKVQEIVQIADAWNMMSARLKLATAGQREYAVASRTRAKNRFRAVLLEADPELERAVDPSSPWQMAVLSELGGAPGCSAAGWGAFADAARRAGAPAARARELWEALDASAGSGRGAGAGEDVSVRMLAREISALDSDVAELDGLIGEALAGDEVYESLLTIPGIGPKTAAALVTAVDISLFGSHHELASYCGVAPADSRSGTSIRSTSPQRGGNKQLKNLLIFSCNSLVGTGNRFGRYYDECRARGMRHNKALKAVARKRMKVVYAIMRDAVPYEPRR